MARYVEQLGNDEPITSKRVRPIIRSKPPKPPRFRTNKAILESDMSGDEKRDVLIIRRLSLCVAVFLTVFAASFPVYYGIKAWTRAWAIQQCVQADNQWVMVRNTTGVYECR